MPRTTLQGAPEPIAALNKVHMTELALPWEEREPLVDVRTYCSAIEWRPHVCPYLRKTAADMLNEAQAALPAGFKLIAGTALRTLHMQKGGWDGYFNRMKEEHPNWPLSALRRATNHFFAPYDQKAPPGHCTGGAVDVGLLNPQGEALDMTAPTKGWEAAYTWSDKISAEAKQNRMMMVEAMLGAGFSNCRDEYWHYSYGDSAWAVRTGRNECPYGWTYAPVALETCFEGGRAGEISVVFERNKNGRPVCAKAELYAPEGETGFMAGLFWARDAEVELTVHTNSTNRTVYKSADRKTWEPVEIEKPLSDGVLFSLVPQFDRIYFTDTLPEQKEE